MKDLFIFILCLVMALSFTACGSGGESGSQMPSYSAEEPIPEEDLLSEDQAIRIVLDRIDGAAASDITSLSLNFDEGRWQYTGELIHSDTEYEFEIDAQNGNILDWEIDD